MFGWLIGFFKWSFASLFSILFELSLKKALNKIEKSEAIYVLKNQIGHTNILRNKFRLEESHQSMLRRILKHNTKACHYGLTT